MAERSERMEVTWRVRSPPGRLRDFVWKVTAGRISSGSRPLLTQMARPIRQSTLVVVIKRTVVNTQTYERAVVYRVRA